MESHHPTDCLFLWKWVWVECTSSLSKWSKIENSNIQKLRRARQFIVYIQDGYDGYTCISVNVNERKECGSEQCTVSVIWLSLSFKVHYCCAMHSSINTWIHTMRISKHILWPTALNYIKLFFLWFFCSFFFDNLLYFNRIFQISHWNERTDHHE